jgi:hypothetical protein
LWPERLEGRNRYVQEQNSELELGSGSYQIRPMRRYSSM